MFQRCAGDRIYGCAVLAGGAGTRMGSINKAEISCNGRTFLEHICTEMKKTGDRRYISVAKYEQITPTGWKAVRDIAFDKNGGFAGPIGGIYSCLKQASEDGLDGVFFAPCDAPFYMSEVSEKLGQYIDEGFDALIWRTEDGRTQMTFGWYSVRCLPVIEEEMAHVNNKLVNILEKVSAKVIDTVDAGLDDKAFLNINDRECYRKILSGKDDGYAESLVLEDAVSLLRLYVIPIKDVDESGIFECTGRTLAEDVVASFDQPPFPRSPLDGYAFKAEDTSGACNESPAQLKVKTEIDAGHYYEGTIGSGEAVRIMTGAPIPDGADAVAGQEDTDYGEDVVSIYHEFRPYQNYCLQGEDYRKGTILLQDRDFIGPAETGIIASTGRDRVKVYRSPRALVISTGDEVIPPGQALSKSKIYDSNLYSVCAQLSQWGVEISGALHSEDDAEKVTEMIRCRIDDADIVITCGGVSVGKKDIIHEVYDSLNVKELIRKVKIKPGMAMLAGTYKEKLLISLSGNPYAAYTGLHMVVRPVIAVLNGSGVPYIQITKAVLMDDFEKRSPVRRYVRAKVTDDKAYIDGHTGGNGDVYSGRGTNALIEIPAGSEKLKAGDIVKVILL